MVWSKQRKRILRYLTFGLLGLFVAGMMASWFVAGWLVSPQPRRIGSPPADLPAKTISLASNSGSTIAGWHIPAERHKGVIVLVHPLRGSRLFMLERARLFVRGRVFDCDD